MLLEYVQVGIPLQLPEVQKFFIGLNQLNFAEKPLTEIVDFIMKEQEYTPEYTDDNLTVLKRIDQVFLFASIMS